MRSAIRNRTRQRQASATERQPADLLGPAALQLRTDRLRVGARWQRTFAISGYPREVGYGWLTPLLRAWPQLEVSLHIEPFPAELAAQRLHKQRARFESTRRLESERGSLSDLGVAAAAHDAEDLATRLARGQSRLYRAGIYLSISTDTEDELAHASERVKALCAAQLLSCAPATLRPLEGWLSTLPLGLDRLRLRRTFDSESLGRVLSLRRRRASPGRQRLLLRTVRLGRAGRLRSLRLRQLQRRHPRPLRRRQKLPRQTRSAPPALPGRAGVRRRPRRRIPTPLPGRRRRLPATRRPRRRHAQPARPPGRPPATAPSPSGSSSSPSWSSCSPADSPAPSSPPSTAPPTPATARPASPTTPTPTPGPRRSCATSPTSSNSRAAKEPDSPSDSAPTPSAPSPGCSPTRPAPSRRASSSASPCAASPTGSSRSRCCSASTRSGAPSTRNRASAASWSTRPGC